MNYEDYLRSKDLDHNVTVGCKNLSCGYWGPSSTIILHKDKWICANCFHEANRPAPEDQDAWNKEKGNDVRAERNQLLAKHAWTVTPVLNEALTEESIADWRLYIQRLNSITIDYAKPSLVVWPTPPTSVYK